MEFIAEAATNWTLRDEILFAPSTSSVSYPDNRRQTNFEVEDQSFWFQHRRKCIETVLQRFPPAGFFLDVGGGNGFMTSALQKIGISAILVEPGEGGCRNALRRGVRHILCGSLEDMDFTHVRAGAVGLFDVLEHIAEESRFLQIVHTSLNSGGRLFLSVPASPVLWSHEDQSAGHFRRYTAAGLKAALETAGFRVLYCSHFFLCLIPGLFFLRVLPYRLNLRRKNSESTLPKEHHLTGRSYLRSLVMWGLAPEVGMLNAHSIPAGTSLVCVAEKI